MRIVVAGGRGFAGREIVDQLLEARLGQVVGTTRGIGGRDPWGGRVEMTQAFAGDRVSLGKAFTRADVVVYCVQFPNHPNEDASRGRTYLETDGLGTEVAVEVAKKLGVRRFIYLSGAGAGQGRPQPWFQAKDRAEAAVRASGMEFAILRPSWMFGPRDRTMNRFAWFSRHLPVVPVIGNGRTPVWPLYVKDLAHAVAECVRREDAKDKVLDLGGPERLTMDQVVTTIQEVLRTRRPGFARFPQPLLHHPVSLMKLLTLPMTLLAEPILTPTAVEFITQEVEMDPKPAQEYFGFRFRPLREALGEYL